MSNRPSLFGDWKDYAPSIIEDSMAYAMEISRYQKEGRK
jgi:hypothetical protein